MPLETPPKAPGVRGQPARLDWSETLTLAKNGRAWAALFDACAAARADPSQRVDVRFLLVDATKMTVLGEGTINLTPLVVGTMTERPVQQLQLVDRRHVTIGHIVASVKAADAIQIRCHLHRRAAVNNTAARQNQRRVEPKEYAR